MNVRCSLLVPALLALLPLASASESDVSNARVVLLDIRELSSVDIDALYALPGVDVWAEFGNTSLVGGAAGLVARLERFSAGVVLRSLPFEHGDLRLVQSHGPSGGQHLAASYDRLADFGRLALVHWNGAPEFESAAVIRVPWNTIVIGRADRGRPPVLRAGANAALVGDAVGTLDALFYRAYVEGLVGFGTRSTNVANFPNVTQWIAERFRQMGLTPTLEPFQISGRTRHNVIAELTGTVTPEDVYVVCGHYDSTSQNAANFAPGADDNASGSGGVLEMARALADFEFDSTIRFITFAGEEQGLVGSTAHVNRVKSMGLLGNVKGVINMDMVAYLNTSRWDVLIEGRPSVSQTMMSLLSSLVAQHTSLVPFTSSNPFGSDHMPYINNGVNAVLTIEYQDSQNPNYHSTSDKISTLTFPFALEILKLNVAATATAAGIHGRSLGSGVAGTAEDYGLGLGGSNVGFLDARTVPNIGTTLFLDVSGFGMAPQVSVAMCRRQASLPRRGGTLLVDLTRRFGTLEATLVGGSATVSFDIPVQLSLVGLSAFLQAGAPDPTRPSGFAFSHGLELTIGQ